MDRGDDGGMMDEYKISVDAVVAEITRQRDDALARLANVAGELAVLKARLEQSKATAAESAPSS